jgi:hypothetical protein
VPGEGRYHCTVTVFGETDPVAAGRTGELGKARSLITGGARLRACRRAMIEESRERSPQLVQEPLRLFQIGGVEAFGEPAVDRREKIAGLLSFALIAGLFLPMGAVHAQDTNTVTATCKDGTPFTGAEAFRRLSGSRRCAVMGCDLDCNQPRRHTSPVYGLDEPAHHWEPGWRPRSGLGQCRQQSLSLPRRSLVRQDQARQLHVRGAGSGAGCQTGSRKGLHLVGRSAAAPLAPKPTSIGLAQH